MNTLRINSVKAVRGGAYKLSVTWADESKSIVDLTGLIHSSENFRVFAQEPNTFKDVNVVNFGTGIGWSNGLDYGADTLKTLADEQKPISGRYFCEFERRYQLNTSETAELFQIAERTVRHYRSVASLPPCVAIAVRRFEEDATVFAAHYRPIKKRGPGRPRKQAH
jgi:hypothetical protein